MNIIYGDCLDVMKTINNDSIDLIMTSPPYVTSYKRPYKNGDIKEVDYAEWFLPRAAEIKRIMKPTGSFVLNIKESVQNGERRTYVLKLILELKESIGFRWNDELIWYKTNPFPIARPTGFKDAFERLHHFTKQKDIKIDKWAVAVPASAETLAKYNRKYQQPELTPLEGSRFRKLMSLNDVVYPPNVISGHVPGPRYQRSGSYHSAAYPDYLPEFFIKAFTVPGDTVLDPFSGSHTTARVAESLDRIGIGIEIMPPEG